MIRTSSQLMLPEYYDDGTIPMTISRPVYNGQPLDPAGDAENVCQEAIRSEFNNEREVCRRPAATKGKNVITGREPCTIKVYAMSTGRIEDIVDDCV